MPDGQMQKRAYSSILFISSDIYIIFRVIESHQSFKPFS